MMRVRWRWWMGIGCVRVVIRFKVRRWWRVAVRVDNDGSVGVVPGAIGVVHGSEGVGEWSVGVAWRRGKGRVVVVVLGVGEGEGRHGAGRQDKVQQGGSCSGALE